MYEFSKMHGAGNDFIVVDDRAFKWPQHVDFIKNICDRRRGIGADGLILLSASSLLQADLKMSFFNSDGRPAEMCGNGLRCAALFSHLYFSYSSAVVFETAAALLKTQVLDSSSVEIEIPVIQKPEKVNIDGREGFFVNTGVPHLVILCDNIADINLDEEGAALRNHQLFQPAGCNVNFVSQANQAGAPISIRTYERGVEGETSACGTGVAASALVLNSFLKAPLPIKFLTRDYDTISVDFYINDNKLRDCGKVLLTGPAVEVFKGTIKQFRS